MNSEQARALFQQAAQDYRARNFETSIEKLDRVVQAFPEHPDAQYARAKCLAKLGRVEDARLVCSHLSTTLGDARGEKLLARLAGVQTAPAPEEATLLAAPEVRFKRLRKVMHVVVGVIAAIFLRPKKGAEGTEAAQTAETTPAADAVPGGEGAVPPAAPQGAEPAFRLDGSAVPDLPPSVLPGKAGQASGWSGGSSQVGVRKTSGLIGITYLMEEDRRSRKRWRRLRALLLLIILLFLWPWRTWRRALAFMVLFLAVGSLYLFRESQSTPLPSAGLVLPNGVVAYAVPDLPYKNPEQLERSSSSFDETRFWMLVKSPFDAARMSDGGLLIAGDSSGLGANPREEIPGVRGLRLVPPTTEFGVFVVRLDAENNLVWSHVFDMPNYNNDEIGAQVRALQFDDAGAVYVAGGFKGELDSRLVSIPYSSETENENHFLFKVDRSGAFQWSRTIPTSAASQNTEVEIDGAGNIYLFGAVGRGAILETDPERAATMSTNARNGRFVAKLDAHGNQLWSRVLNRDWYSVDLASRVYPSGHVLIITVLQGSPLQIWSEGTAPQELFRPGSRHRVPFGLMLDPTGEPLWQYEFPSGVEIFGSVIDRDGSIYIAGTFGNIGQGGYVKTVDLDLSEGGVSELTSAGNIDAFVAKYSREGALEWARSVGGSGKEVVEDILLDDSGRIALRLFSSLGPNTFRGATGSPETEIRAEGHFVMIIGSDGSLETPHQALAPRRPPTGSDFLDLANSRAYDRSDWLSQ